MKWSWGSRKEPRRADSVYRLLKGIPLFSELSWLELRRLEHIVHPRTYEPGETIFYEGEPGVGMYIVWTGKVNLIKDGKQAKDHPLAVFKGGDFFGEIALLTESPRTATAVAAEPTSLLGFFRPDLLSLLVNHHKMGSKVLLKISQVVAQRLVQTMGVKSEIDVP